MTLKELDQVLQRKATPLNSQRLNSRSIAQKPLKKSQSVLIVEIYITQPDIHKSLVKHLRICQ